MPSVHWFGHVLCFYLWARLKLVYSNLCCFFVVKSCQTFATAWTVAHQAPWSMGFPRQGYWNELLFPPPGDLPDQGLNLGLLLGRQIHYHQAHWEAILILVHFLKLCWLESGLHVHSLGVILKLVLISSQNWSISFSSFLPSCIPCTLFNAQGSFLPGSFHQKVRASVGI